MTADRPAVPQDAPRQVLVCGSRGWKNAQRVRDTLARLASESPIEVMHGGAEGADIAAYWTCLELGITARSFLPDYKTHGKSAPHVRNDRMLDRAGLVVAFWDGQSRGTKSVIAKAKRRGIPVLIVEAEETRW